MLLYRLLVHVFAIAGAHGGRAHGSVHQVVVEPQHTFSDSVVLQQRAEIEVLEAAIALVDAPIVEPGAHIRAYLNSNDFT